MIGSFDEYLLKAARTYLVALADSGIGPRERESPEEDTVCMTMVQVKLLAHVVSRG